MRDLRDHGGRVLDRVAAGERVVITRDGAPVARLGPLPAAGLGAAALVARFARLPRVDSEALRRDVDTAVDQRL